MSKEKIILLAVSSSIFVEALDIAIVNLAVPLIQQDFHLGNDSLHWIQTLYVLFYGGFLILGGKLSDTLGKKNVFLVGSTLFLLTSAGAGLSGSFPMIVVFRSIQGLAAALLMPSALSIVTNTFHEPHSRNQALGVFGSFAAIGSGSGLSIGGLIASYLGWKWIFFINVPIIAITMVLAYRLIPQDRTDEKSEFPDILTSAFLTSAILILTYLIHELESVRQNVFQILGGVVLIGVLVRMFLNRNRKNGARLIDFSLYKNRPTITANSVIIMMGAFFSSYLFLISIILQTKMKFSAAQSGLMLLPFSILSALVSRFVIPKMMQRLSTIKVAIIGMTLFVLGGAFLALAISFDNNILLTLLSIACSTGTGIAVCFSSLMVLAIQRLPQSQHGLASSIAQSSFFFGSGIGLSIVGLVLGAEGLSSNTITLAVIAMAFFAVIGVLTILLSKSHERFTAAASR